MSHSTARAYLDEVFAPLLPEEWKWIPYQRNLDALESVTVVWKQSTLSRLREAPIGTVLVEGTITILSPHQDVERAEEDLDEAVLDLVLAIDSLPALAWSGATKVSLNDTFFGYDLTVSTTVTAPTSPPAPDPEPDPEPDLPEE